MPELWLNNAESTLAAGITAGATSVPVQTGHGARFPSPTGDDYFWLTAQEGNTIEVMRCTARSGDTLTVTRAQQGTAASAFTAGAKIELRITARALQDLQLFVERTAGRVELADMTDAVVLAPSSMPANVGTKLLVYKDTNTITDYGGESLIYAQLILPNPGNQHTGIGMQGYVKNNGSIVQDQAHHIGLLGVCEDTVNGRQTLYGVEGKVEGRGTAGGQTYAGGIFFGNFIGTAFEGINCGLKVLSNVTTNGATPVVGGFNFGVYILPLIGGANRFAVFAGDPIRSLCATAGDTAIQGDATNGIGGQFLGASTGMQAQARTAGGTAMQVFVDSTGKILSANNTSAGNAEVFHIDGLGRLNLTNNQPIRGLNAAGSLYYELLKLNPTDQIQFARAYYSPIETVAGTAFDWASSNTKKKTMTASMSPTFTGGAAGGQYILFLEQDATGGRTVTWPSNVKWAGSGLPPVIATGAAQKTVLVFTFDGTDYIGQQQSEEVVKRLTVNRTSTSVDNGTATGPQTAITDMSFAIDANEVWTFELTLRHGSSSTAGLRVGLTVPTGATILQTMVASLAASTLAYGVSTASGLILTTINTAGNANGFATIRGTVTNGANAGNVQLVASKVTSGTATIYADSNLVARRAL